MNAPNEQNPREERTGWRRFFGRLPLETETARFIGVSALDVFFTYLLLAYGGYYEANPIAWWFIAGWGIKGMVYFKFGMVALITVLAQLIAVRHLVAARRVLNFGTLVVSVVVIYSLTLLVRNTNIL